jgi:hypothetical protein
VRALRNVTIAALALWTAAAVGWYLAAVGNSCSDPEQDCGLAVAFGLGAAVMIWVVGLAVIAVMMLLVRFLILRFG